MPIVSQNSERLEVGQHALFEPHEPLTYHEERRLKEFVGKVVEIQHVIGSYYPYWYLVTYGGKKFVLISYDVRPLARCIVWDRSRPPKKGD